MTTDRKLPDAAASTPAPGEPAGRRQDPGDPLDRAVQVDLRGFGGSSGCLDRVRPGEQADVKAGATVPDAPANAGETSDGTWRSEPPADSAPVATILNGGTYADDGTNNAAGDGAGAGIWTVSPPLGADAHLAGVPQVAVDVAAGLHGSHHRELLAPYWTGARTRRPAGRRPARGGGRRAR
jgi:hypothetical protein